MTAWNGIMVRWGAASALLPTGEGYAGSCARVSVQLEFVHQALGAAEAHAHAGAGGPPIGQREVDVGNAGALVLEAEAEALLGAVEEHFPGQGAAAAVN